MSKCLFCYKELPEGVDDFHSKCSKQFFQSSSVPSLTFSLVDMEKMATESVLNRIAVPGVQRKLSMAIDHMASGKDRLTVVGTLGGNFILKPPSDDYPEMPANEHLTMKLADLFGIPTVPSSLVRLASGELAYLSRRIDRKVGGEKIHMLDMFQILEAFDKYRGSMERVGKAIKKYSTNTLLDVSYLFDLTLFCFITGNNDMHLKNFSMIEQENGWALAPAYDLLNVSILLPEDREETALTIGGKKAKLTKESFETFGEHLGLNPKQISGAFKRLERHMKKVSALVEKSFLSEGMKENYLGLLERRFNILDV